MRRIIFAKTKRARRVCAVLAVISLAIAILAAYYTVGNLLCAADSPTLVGENGGAVFLGYYMLAGAYAFVGAIAIIACGVFGVNWFSGQWLVVRKTRVDDFVP